MEELESLGGIKEQLANEKTHADQLQEVFHGVREERDQLRRDLQEKMEEVESTGCLTEEISFFLNLCNK